MNFDDLHSRLSAADSLENVDGIESEARDAWPRNFTRQLVARGASKVGDALASPRHVLPWLLSACGVESGWAATLVPVREAGSLLPQLALSSWMQRREHRRGMWALGSVVQAAAVLGIVLATLLLEGRSLGIVSVMAMAVFAVGRAGQSLASKDLLGRTIPQGRRGRLSGTSASIAGGVALGAGALLALLSGVRHESVGISELRLIVVLAAVAWIVSAVVVHRLQEPPAPRGGETKSAMASWSLLRENPAFGRFCLARGLLAGTVLAMPYVSLLTKDSAGTGFSGLGGLVVASASAQLLSGTIWGRFADVSSRRTMLVGGLGAAVVLLGVVALEQLRLSGASATSAHVVAFFLLSVGHTGIRQGRKTYIVDLAPSEDRPAYIALANTLMGWALLASAGAGWLAQQFGPEAMLLVLATLGICGALLTTTLPEVEGKRD